MVFPAYMSLHILLKDKIITLEGVQRRSARFVCNKFSYHESVIFMLNELDWPSFQQRRVEKRMALFHRVVNETVDVEALALMTRTKRSSQKLNRVQYQTHSSKKDCYKYSFVPRSIIQWNNIDAPDDHTIRDLDSPLPEIIIMGDFNFPGVL